jgi:hypothetical protein
MTNRFTVERQDKVYWIRDTEYKTYNMPEKAVSIYIGSYYRALSIADVLNSEWQQFLKNPT